MRPDVGMVVFFSVPGNWKELSMKKKLVDVSIFFSVLLLCLSASSAWALDCWNKRELCVERCYERYLGSISIYSCTNSCVAKQTLCEAGIDLFEIEDPGEN